MNKTTSTVSITKETKKKLEKLGSKGDSFDKIISKVLEQTQGCKSVPSKAAQE